MLSSMHIIYRCKLPSEHTLDNLDWAFEQYNPKDPVVVFLDTEKVKSIIDDDNIGSFSPNPERFSSIEQMLSNKLFALPIIMFGMHNPRVYDGQHRTTAMLFRGESTIPFLTARAMAPNIVNHLGSSSSREKFDLSDVKYEPYEG